MLLILATLLITSTLILALHQPAQRLGLVDRPDARKQHAGAIPLTGGLAITLGCTVSLVSFVQASHLYTLLLGMLALAALGALDDRLNLGAKRRLCLQATIVWLVCWHTGVQINSLGNLLGTGELLLGIWALPFSVFAIVGVINALNMIDGLDGLAGGLALVVTAALLFFSPNAEDSQVLLILAGALLGFLCFNLRHPWRAKASVFLGDAGSTTLGLVLGWFLLRYSQTEHTGGQHYPPALALWLLAAPLLDTVSLMFRRALRGQSPFAADRQHLHHALLRAGFSDAQVTLLIIASSILLSFAATLAWRWLSIPEYGLFYAFLAAFALYCFATQHAWKLSKWLHALHA